eukprot:CAMPEP_0118662062 /NCGR_PEP_ID=MMETSP0785-20121206/16619_1 /TAXON_ID=91992 /ORGANISM="Bolidomonas pacifica, Strain CCMP 1866" /LENGTH=487 /DNA_ID=CAMNT_0006555557 /DNA_START=60 /DNA_END=1520 /DNA_ORIENTATION=+
MSSMTPEALKEIIKKDKQYITPELNDKLYLHYKGFRKIENLEPYVGLKVLWLEGNGLDKIEGLAAQTKMRTLYLQENIINKLENLESMTDLDTLNVSKNFINKIENLGHMKKLSTLIISNNNLADASSIAHAAELPNLHALDIQSNKIDDDPEAILSILASCPELRVVYLKGNDVVKKIKHYRKTIISRCKNLRYLDDRPVFDDERRRCNAWGKVMKETNGDVDKANEAEREEIANIRMEKKEREERAFLQFEEMVKEGQKIKKAREEEERKANGGELPASEFISTDHKTFGMDGSKIDEKKVSSDVGIGSHLIKVDREKEKLNINPFSGEKIIEAKESELVTEARKQRWSDNERVLSQNVPISDLPPPPPSSNDEEIWGQDELTDEALKEKEIEEYYTKTAGDTANFEKGERGQGNAASAMNAHASANMATELTGLEEKAAKLRMEASKQAEERRKLEEPPPVPPSSKPAKAGIGGRWPVKSKTSN